MGSNRKKNHQRWIVEGERAAEPGDMPLIFWRCLSMIPDSGIILWLVKLMSSCWRIRSAIDSIAVFQYQTPTIQENIFENTDFEQAIQIFLQAQDFWLIPRLQEEQKICLWSVAKRTQSIQNTSSFSCTPCDQLRSHLKSSWLINQRSKGTRSHQNHYKTLKSVYICKECMLYGRLFNDRQLHWKRREHWWSIK